ncbi:hypothetical protein FOZ61_002356 [Perkinsus olseni]|uniref:Uncharacterized protein n=1 Tax=Perkinsus olseni TaxID=32597 RepID=A0A7J6LTD9_PEROL|nr:hypothetical protein FOZ61_002356 [Perkinsus olseni]
MAAAEKDDTRQAASIYELCMKLGHELDDVRDRAVRALMTKTSTGLTSPITVARVVEFPQLALHWLNDRHRTAHTDLVKSFIKFYTSVVATCVAENAHLRERFISSGAIDFFEDFRGFEARYAEEIDAALSCLLSQTGPSSSVVQRPPKTPRPPPGHAAVEAEAAKTRPSWIELVAVSSADERRLFEASCRIKYSSVGRSKRVAALNEVRYLMVYDYPAEVFFSKHGVLICEALVAALADNIEQPEDARTEDPTCKLVSEALHAVLLGLEKKLKLNEKLSVEPCIPTIHLILVAVVSAIVHSSSAAVMSALQRSANTAIEILQRGEKGARMRCFFDLGLAREEIIKYLDLVADALARYFCPSEYYEASAVLSLVRAWTPTRLAVFDLCSELLVMSRDVFVQRKRNEKLVGHLRSWSLDPQLYHHRPELVEELVASVLQSVSIEAYRDFRALHASEGQEQPEELSEAAKAARQLSAMGFEDEEYHWSGDSYAAVELRYATTDIPEAHRVAYERKLDVLLSSRPPLEVAAASSRTAEMIFGQYSTTLRHAFTVGRPRLRDKVTEAMQCIITAMDSRRQLSLVPEEFLLDLVTLACNGVKQKSFRPSLWLPFILLLLQSDGLREITLHSVRLLCTMVIHLGPNVVSTDVLQLGIVPYVIRPMANCGTACHFMVTGSLWLLYATSIDTKELRNTLMPLTHAGNTVLTRRLAWRALAEHFSEDLEERAVDCALSEECEVEVRLECLRIMETNMSRSIAAKVVQKLPSLMGVEQLPQLPDDAMREAVVSVMGAIEDEESLKALARELTKMNLWSAVIDSGSPSGVWSLVSRCMDLDSELLPYLSMHTTLFDASRAMPLCGPMLQVLRSLRAQLGARRSAQALRPAVLWMSHQGERMAGWVREWVTPCLVDRSCGTPSQLPWKASLALASISCIGDSINLFQTATGEKIHHVEKLNAGGFVEPVTELLPCFRPEHISTATCDVAIALQSLLSSPAMMDPAAANAVLGRIAKALSESITGLQMGTPRSASTPRERSCEAHRFVAALTQLLGRVATLHPVLSLEAEASPFVRAFKIVWSASTSSRRSPGELASDELTAVLLDSLNLAQCQQTAAKVGPRLVEDGWIEMLKPIPSGRQPITPTLQAAIGRMVLALCLSPCPAPRRNLIVSESAVETLWRRAVENEDADAFMAMAVISCHTSKMAGLMGSLVKTKSDCADMTTACHGNLMHVICLHFREDSDFRPYRV